LSLPPASGAKRVLVDDAPNNDAWTPPEF